MKFILARFSQHPPGLVYLFFAEMWERFSYYSMQALLILYMTKYLQHSDHQAVGVFACYGALVYTTPMVGGLIADCILGKRNTILIGGVLIALGHFYLAWPYSTLGVGLALLIVGTGLFKSNVTSLLGDLYEKNDSKRDAGFTIYYVGINLGAILAILICGFIGEVYSWYLSFSLGGFGMLLGLYTFYRGLAHYQDAGRAPKQPYQFRFSRFSLPSWQLVALLISLMIPCIAIILTYHDYLIVLEVLLGLVSMYCMIYLALHSNAEERASIITILVLMIFSAAFFSLFKLSGSAINLFTDRIVDRNLFGVVIPASMFLTFDSVFIILLGPLFSSLWISLAVQKRDPMPPTKYAIGLLLSSSAFLVLICGIQHANTMGMITVGWLVLAKFMMTTGELCISPVGLSVVSKLAPKKVAALIMGIWFVSISMGQFLAGVFAKLATVPTKNGQVIDLHLALSIYNGAFYKVMCFGLSMASVLFLISPWLTPVFHRLAQKQPILANRAVKYQVVS